MRLRSYLLLTVPAIGFLAVFFVLPFATVVLDAFQENTQAFDRVFSLPAFWPSLAGSLLLTLVAASLSTLVGFAVALHLSRLPERLRTAYSLVIALPLTFSGLIVAYGFILGYGRSGFFTLLLGYAGLDPVIVGKALFTPWGLAVACSYYLIPRVVLGILPVLVNFDRAQILVAESLGASPAQALRQVMLPQIAAPLGAAFCLVAAVVFGAYGTALALVGTQLHILPLQLYSLISETGTDFPAAAALALMITAACAAIMTTGEWFGNRYEHHL